MPDGKCICDRFDELYTGNAFILYCLITMHMNHVMMSLIPLFFSLLNQELQTNSILKMYYLVMLIDIYSLASSYYTMSTNRLDLVNAIVQ